MKRTMSKCVTVLNSMFGQEPRIGVNIEARRVWYKSKDGTKVPMFVVHRKDLTLDGDRPTLLTSELSQ